MFALSHQNWLKVDKRTLLFSLELFSTFTPKPYLQVMAGCGQAIGIMIALFFFKQISIKLTYLIIQMQREAKVGLFNTYNQLPPKIKSFVRFQNLSIREVDVNGQLQKLYMAFATFISVQASRNKGPFSIVVTASHNPPDHNGIKLEPLEPIKDLNVKQLLEIINSDQRFIQFLDKAQFRQSTKKIDFFIGRDTRTSSKRLSEILIETLKSLGNKVVDFGERSTPEITSLSQFIVQNNAQNSPQTIKKLSNFYFQQIEQIFCQAISLISEQTGKQWVRKKICFDFANGVGAISFKNYQFLKKYFEIKTTFDQDFSQPNVKCGANWIYDHRLKLPNLEDYPEADFYVWFDGDSDRIIMKVKQQKELIQGEDFNYCFILWLRQLLKELNLQLKLGCVGNINTNFSLIERLDSLNIQNEQAPVGISNLFKAAQRYDVCSFFQPNGHGCIYFSETALKALHDKKKKHWQAQFLILIYGLQRNNTRGYALHNFLVLQLYFYHQQTSNALLFQKMYSLERDYALSNPQLFENAAQGEKLLIQPKQLTEKLKQVCKKYGQLTIKIRKSQTSAVLRVTLQGSQNTCMQCALILQQTIKPYL